jgi:hypothetical protein
MSSIWWDKINRLGALVLVTAPFGSYKRAVHLSDRDAFAPNPVSLEPSALNAPKHVACLRRDKPSSAT